MFQVHINGTIEAVWNELTRSDKPILALFNSRMETNGLQAGSKMAMRSPDGKYTGVVGEILEVIPLKRFAHTFKFTNFDDPPCKVVFDLEEANGGVNFTLTIEHLPEGTKTAKQMIQGGTMITNTMKSVIETGKPSFGIRMLYVLFKLLAFMSPKKCLSSNWPIEGDWTVKL